MSTEATESTTRRDRSQSLGGGADETRIPEARAPEAIEQIDGGGPKRRTGAHAAKPRPSQPMGATARRGIGVALFLLSALLVAHLLWAWSFTARLVAASGGSPAPIRVHWLVLTFTPTVDWALLLVVTFTAAAGSTAHSALVFSNRAGLGTLESTWALWYLLRPGAAAIVGALTYIIVKAGFLGSVDGGDDKGLAFAAAVGALAGLFTDTLMEKLRTALGASPFHVPTAAQATAGGTGGRPEDA
jgi:hypothetical protein